MKVHPTFGNLIVEERPYSVALRLRTGTDGLAHFTYREIAILAGILAGISPPTGAPVLDLDEDDLALLG